MHTGSSEELWELGGAGCLSSVLQMQEPPAVRRNDSSSVTELRRGLSTTSHRHKAPLPLFVPRVETESTSARCQFSEEMPATFLKRKGCNSPGGPVDKSVVNV